MQLNFPIAYVISQIKTWKPIYLNYLNFGAFLWKYWHGYYRLYWLINWHVQFDNIFKSIDSYNL